MRVGEPALAEAHRFKGIAGMDELILCGDESQLATAGVGRDHEEPIDHCRGVRECPRHILAAQQTG